MTGTAKIIGALAVLLIVIAWEIYRWQDCRAVGHSVLYCILTSGK